MKKALLWVSVLVCISALTSGYAIDRDAKFIDSLGFNGLSCDRGDVRGAALWGETALATFNRRWSIVFGGGMGTDSPEGGSDADYWSAILGMKYYFSHQTSLTVGGDYLTTDDRDITTGRFFLKHRFINLMEGEGVSPFVTASLGYRSAGNIGAPGHTDEMVETLGVGCEFMITDTLSITFEGSYLRGDRISGEEPDLGNGGMLGVYLTAYFN